MNFPSGEHSGIATAPLAVRWYVVFADISPFVIVKLLPANISYVIRVEIQFVHTHSTPPIERNIVRSLLCVCWQDNSKISLRTEMKISGSIQYLINVWDKDELVRF